MPPTEPQTMVEAAAAVRTGRLSPVELVEQSLAAAKRTVHLNALACLDADRALQVARERAREAEAGRFRGPLHGVPVTVKEIFSVEGFRVRGGTRAPLPPLADWDGASDALAVARLRRAGAVVLGTTNMVEIALGIHGENPWTGPVRNPHDPARQAGGSSSGSAAAVAAGVGWASLGTDTGGSIRIPAGLCGVVGVKPTWGSVPLRGALPLSRTCDHAGPFARTVADAAALVQVLTSAVPLTDLPLTDLPLTDPAPASRPAAPRRLGVPWSYLGEALDAGVRERFEALVERLARSGVDVRDVEVHRLDAALGAYQSLVRAEAAYVHRDHLAAGGEGFSEPIREALEEGAAMSATDYLECRRVRGQVLAGLARVFAEVDALVLPATPVPAPPIGSDTVEVERGPVPHRWAFLRLTAPFSFVGVPVATLPYDEVGGLPLGVQVVGPRGEDAALLGLAAWLEKSIT